MQFKHLVVVNISIKERIQRFKRHKTSFFALFHFTKKHVIMNIGELYGKNKGNG